MTEETDSRRTLWSRFFRGRRPGPLMGPWVSSLIFAGLLWYVETTIPALHDVIGIIYWMLLALVLFTTLRWLRARSGDRRARNDRRRIDRRDEED
jgi:hypothetical protein